MTAYLDNNVIIEIEKGNITIPEIERVTGCKMQVIYYSMSHIFEASEITANSKSELNEKLLKRFKTITDITKNNYLDRELPSNIVSKVKVEPSIAFETINENTLARNSIKQLVNMTSETQKKLFRMQLDVDPLKINNYSPKEVIEKINSNRIAFGGYNLIELIEKAVELHPDGKGMSLHNRFAGVFEILDLVGFWKDKFNEKSNYARLWDSSHAYFSSFCDYFISDDKRTRYKSEVVFELYDVKTKVVSSRE